MTPKLAVIFFGTEPKYIAYLNRWVERYKTCGTKLPAVLVTDMETQVPWLGEVVRVDPDASIIRRAALGNSNDYKGALIIGAIEQGIGPALFMDSDTELLADPEPTLPLEQAIALAPDVTAPLLNGGVIWVRNANAAPFYREVFAKYKYSRLSGREDLYEQDVWGLVAVAGPWLPKTLNWQGHFWGPNPDAIIRHLHGGDINATEQVRDPLPYLRKPRIAVGVISYEGQYHGRHMDSVTNLYKMDTGYEINVIKIEGAICSKGRNGIAREAMAWGAEALLFIDDDISFNPDHFTRIISHLKDDKIDIVGGLYSAKTLPGRWIYDPEAGERVNGDGLLRVKDIGTGFLLIRTRVFQRMVDELWETIEYSSDDPHSRGVTLWDFFPMGPVGTPGNRRYLTEDYYFCHRCNEMKIPIYADTTVRLKHRGFGEYPLDNPPITVA